MIYFDNAATGFPKSDGVALAMLEAHKNCGNPGRSGHEPSMNSSRIMFECRKALAEMFGTTPERVVLTSGATESLNIAIKGVCRSGVTLISDMEHNAVLRPVSSMRKTGKTVMKQFCVSLRDDRETVENFCTASSDATYAVITHGSNVCGKLLPIKEMKKHSKKELVVVLDASQTAGHIPMKIKDLGVDIMCIPGHKGLYGPMGTGALIINPDSRVIPLPLMEGGTGTESKNSDMPKLLPERLEAGTQNICGIAGLLAAVREHRFSSSEMKVFGYIVDELRRMVDITLYGAPQPSIVGYVPVLLFNKRGLDCEELNEKLWERGIACRAGFHCAPMAHRALGTYDTGGVRLSLGRESSFEQAEQFLDTLVRIK